LHTITGHAHLDLKLENLLVGENNQLKITDLGMAAPHHVPQKETRGTLEYMPPEVFNAEKTGSYDGIKADIWSLGVILFILEFGQPPWKTPDPADKIYGKFKRKPE
jgi:serine/threonine protein kinase